MFPLSDPILVFAILTAVMLAAPLLGERLRVPGVVILLAAGAALGPHGGHVLARSSAVTLFGSVGLLYIMFLAGLEIDLDRFMASRRRSIFFGLLTFAIPQAIGTVAARWLLDFSWPAALLLASLFASHTLLAYPIASQLGLTRRESVTITVGATIVTDTLALLVLAVIADSAKGMVMGPRFFLEIGAGGTLLLVLIFRGLPRLAQTFFRRVSENDGAQFIFVLFVICCCAYLSHFARMEPIIGAFLAGAALNRLIPEHSPLMNRVVFVGNTLFIPFFLISVGMLADFGLLVRDPASWKVAGLMVGVVIATKYAAARLTARLFGYCAAEGQVMFGLSVVQAAATLAAVLVGHELKIFDDTVLNGAIAMIVVTCPLGSWFVSHYGRRVDLPPTVATAPVTIGRSLLVPVRNPRSASGLLELAFQLHETEGRPCSIHPFVVIDDDADAEAALAKGEELLAHCLSCSAAVDLPIQPGLRLAANIPDALIRAARERHADTLLLGWPQKKTTGTRVFGSVTDQLMRTAPTRLLTCRLAMPLGTTRRLFLVVPPFIDHRVDFEESIAEAKRLGRRIGANIQLCLTGRDAVEQAVNIEKIAPIIPMTLTAETTWVRTRGRLTTCLETNDLVFLLTERPGGLFWSPSLDPLPGLLAARFPSVNLIVSYPPLAAPADAQISEPDRPTDDAPELPPITTLEWPDAAETYDQLLAAIAGTAYPAAGAAKHGELVRLLHQATTIAPTELIPGITLLHTHDIDLPTAAIVIVRLHHPHSLPDHTDPTRFILALLIPRSTPPEAYLQLLALLARKTRRFTAATLNLGEATADDLRRLILPD